MAESDTTAKTGTGRGMKIVLILSLTLNLLVAGIVLGAITGRHWHGDRSRDLAFGPFTSALSDRDRAALRDAFLASAPGLRDLRAERQADLTAFLTILRAEVWDGAAAEAALAAQGQRTLERLALGRRLLIERIGAMAPAERAAFADRVEAAAARPWRRSGRGD
ncbi:MAG: periplasmic heavy metal sensor [Rhodobacteraceae bacterium]|nr:periplasmic heavy metal sensor [Paracoccaceae bacterium]